MKSISGKEFCRLLGEHGWERTRINGSHHIFTKPGQAVRLSVPVHGNQSLKIGLLKSLMKLAGLAEADL
jgi:predicted RNA binding protein YcfA (HicA-like mRNA interferase family)